MKNYETVVLCRREISPQQFETILNDIESYLTECKAEIARKENWGLRSLAYKIRKSSKAYYGMINYRTTADHVSELQRRLGLDENVVRELTVTTEDLPTEPSLMVRVEDKS